MSAITSSIERELIGVCKQTMLALRQQLQQYINELHSQIDIDDLSPYILTAANEFCMSGCPLTRLRPDHAHIGSFAQKVVNRGCSRLDSPSVVGAPFESITQLSSTDNSQCAYPNDQLLVETVVSGAASCPLEAIETDSDTTPVNLKVEAGNDIDIFGQNIFIPHTNSNSNSIPVLEAQQPGPSQPAAMSSTTTQNRPGFLRGRGRPRAIRTVDDIMSRMHKDVVKKYWSRRKRQFIPRELFEIEKSLFHSVTFADGKWKCPVRGCNRECVQKSTINRHIIEMHTKSNGFSRLKEKMERLKCCKKTLVDRMVFHCHMCSYESRRRPELQRHMHNNHGIDPKEFSK